MLLVKETTLSLIFLTGIHLPKFGFDFVFPIQLLSGPFSSIHTNNTLCVLENITICILLQANPKFILISIEIKKN